VGPLLATVAALTLSAAPECGLPPLRPGGPPWASGEALSFDVDLMGIVKAGTLSMDVQRPTLRGTQLPLRARFHNTSVFAKVRRIAGTAMSWVDATTMLPERFRDEVVENEVRRVSDARIPASGEVVIENQLGAERKTSRYARRGQVLDVLSAAYHLRAAALRPGQEICFDLVANRNYWHLQGKVAPKTERVESAAGIFDTLRIDATVTRADQPAARRPIHLWLSTDSRRLLVAAVGEIELGPVRAMLARVSR
jgi:hypothetical protein